MKISKTLLLVLVIVLISSYALAAEFIGVRAPKNMKIDGRLDEWENAKPYGVTIDRLDYLVAGNASEWLGPQDISGTFYVMYDDEYLYVAAEIIDDELYVDFLALISSSQMAFKSSFPGMAIRPEGHHTLLKTSRSVLLRDSMADIQRCGSGTTAISSQISSTNPPSPIKVISSRSPSQHTRSEYSQREACLLPLTLALQTPIIPV